MVSNEQNHNRPVTGELRNLMILAQMGDENAYQSLLEKLYPLTEKHLTRSIKNHALREEVVQDVLLSVHLARNSYNPELTFEAWFYSIVKRRSIDYLRKVYRHKKIADANQLKVATEAESHDTQSPLTIAEIKETLLKLPEESKKLLALLSERDFDAVVTAQALGVGDGAMRVRIHRLFSLLKERMK